MQRVYLDNNATTRPDDAVARAVDQAQRGLWANPSSVHRFGQEVRQRVELARREVAELIGSRARGLVFTSGGTEANNLALQGVLGRGGTLITTDVEHAAVREPADALERAGAAVVRLPLCADGRVDPASLSGALARADAGRGPVLVSVMWANNETGVIQPVAELAAAVDAARRAAAAEGYRPKLWLHTDATQAVGKLPVDVGAAGVDLLTLAAHKLHGPKGVGGLYVGPGVPLRAVQRGGPQERERRGGTENVPAVVGFGVAAQQALAFVSDPARVAALAGLRDTLEQRVRAGHPGMVVNGARAPRLWNTANLGFPGLLAEAILLGLSERGVCASAGAACSSGSLEPSPVLRAMGVEESVAHGSVRLSLSRETTAAEVDTAAEALVAVVERLGKVMPMGGSLPSDV